MGKNEPFPSLFALKNAHRDLIAQRRQGVDDVWLAAVTQFIERGSATGCLLEDDEARWDAQNLLDYWSNELFHNERKAPDATLAEFDPSTLPRLLDSQCPYLGLDAFNTNNHDYFFGRDKIIKKMIARLQNGRFLAIIGPSGSGKSSTALAGLLPQLQNGALSGSREWTYLPPLMPGAHPLESLANSLVYAAEPAGPIVEQLAQSPTYLADRLDEIAPNGAVLIIDQFEELYTLCHDNRYRLILIDSLIEVLQRDANLHTIIITMRTDLESNLMRTAVFQ
ncbi:MAG: hypothetical protein KC421_04975, partial [Anaerolineales bacterium]|nr:hypothetical protein [Anaerolineales bacterium]